MGSVFFRRFTRVQARGIVAAILVSLVGAGFSAQAGLVELGKPRGAIRVGPAPTGFEAEDHFPGAALLTAADDEEAMLAGTTGTIALPDMPVPDIAVADSSIQPAEPFRLVGSATDKARALQCLTTAVYYEAAREPTDGQRAVAQVVLNRVRHPAFPPSVCGVVFQGSGKPVCQFSFACDGSMARAPQRDYWERARAVAAEALAGHVFAPAGLATHYHTFAVTPSWNKSLVMTGEFGAHFFHRWKGWWGTPAAFHQAYRGREPVPGPDARIETAAAVAPIAAPTPAASPTPAAAKPKAAAATPAAAIQPAHVQSGSVLPRYAAAQDDAESMVLDKWKDSGKPIR